MSTPSMTPVTGDELQRDAEGFITSPYFLHNLNEPLELPWGWLSEGKLDKRLEVTHMTGDEEDLLVDELAGEWSERLAKVTVACITRLGPISVPRERSSDQTANLEAEFAKLTAADRFFALLAVRRASHGDKYEFDATCPNQNCRERESIQSVDLSVFPVHPSRAPTVRLFDVELPHSKKKVTWRPMLGTDEKRLELALKQNPKAQLTVQLWGGIVSVDGAKLASWADLKKWHTGDRDALRAAQNKDQVGVAVELIASACPACRADIRTPLSANAGFFLPSSVGQAGR